MTPPLRSRFIGGTVVVGALALVAAACTSSSPPQTTSTTEPVAPTTVTLPFATTTITAPLPTTTLPPTTSTTESLFEHPIGGEVLIAVDDEPTTLNSFLPGGSRLVNTLIGQGYAVGVSEIDAYTTTFVPDLVTDLPTVTNEGVVVNADGTMTVTYTIRDEAQWDDGTPISGDDFQFTLDTILSLDDVGARLNYQDIIASTAGPKTFAFTMARPTVQYELMFDEIIPKHEVEGTNFLLDWNDKRWASSGPFIFDEWAKGQSITLRRNPNYWKTDPETDQQLPYLDTVTFEFMSGISEMTDAFKARDVDVFGPDLPIDDIEPLQSVESQGARVEVLLGPVWEHLNFQFGPGRLDRNSRSCNEFYDMRLAIAQTIDKEVLTEDVLRGHLEPLESYVDPYYPTVSHDAWSQYSHDVDAAAENYAKAVAASGKDCTATFTTTLDNDARVRTSELLADMFAEAGIPFENDLEDNSLFLGQTLLTGAWDMGEWTWQGSPGFSGLVSIHDVFDPEAAPPNGSNFYRWGSEDSSVIDDSTERFAELRDEMNATVDADELVELIQEAERILADTLVIIPLYAYPMTAAVWEDEISGFKHNINEAGYTWNIESWRRADL